MHLNKHRHCGVCSFLFPTLNFNVLLMFKCPRALSRRSAWIHTHTHIYHSSLSSNKFTCLLLLIREFLFFDLSDLSLFSIYISQDRKWYASSIEFFLDMWNSCIHVQHGDIYIWCIQASPSLISIVGITSSVLIVTSLTCIYIVTKAG
jgi:hypothetical protein